MIRGRARRGIPRLFLTTGLNRRAAFLVITVDLYPLPHPVHAIRIAAGERVNGSAVLCVNDKYAPNRRLPVVTDQRAGGDHVDIVLLSLVKMNPVRTVLARVSIPSLKSVAWIFFR